MLTIDFLGQACTAIKCHVTGVEIISDPWFSDIAHADSWHAFPEWSKSEQKALRERVDQASYIYLSHDHADHFDPEFLQSLGPKTILVGDFQNTRFRKQLQELSQHHEIRFIKHAEVIMLKNELSVQVFHLQPAFRTDSIMLIKSPDAVILNGNDCPLDSATLRYLGRVSPPTVFMFTLNFMASGFPISYLFSHDPTFRSRMDMVRNEVVAMFKRSVEHLNPKLSVAFAGPVTFGDPINKHLNAHPESCNWDKMICELRQTAPIVWPAPFSRIECTEGNISGTDIRAWDLLRNRPILKSQPVPVLNVSEVELIEKAQRFACEMSEVLQQMGQHAQTSLVLSSVSSVNDIESDNIDWSIEINLDDRVVKILGDTPLRPPYLQIVAPAQLLVNFLDHELNIDGLLLSARGRFRRDPDTFNQALHNVLRYGADKMSSRALVNWYKRRAKCQESFQLMVGNEKRRIPKFCPHEGEDLESASIEANTLVCPRHHWRFDLTTGQCTVGDRTVNLYTLTDQTEP